MTIRNVSKCSDVIFYIIVTDKAAKLKVINIAKPNPIHMLFGTENTLLNPSRELFTHSFIHSFLTMWL